MAGHPQNSPRGLWAAAALNVGADGIKFTPYSTTTALLDSDTTGLTVAGGVKVSGQANGLIRANSTGVRLAGQARINDARYVGANSTAFTFTAQAAKPTTRTAGFNWSYITNSTGVSGVMVRTTGTTWKYLNVTSVLPT